MTDAPPRLTDRLVFWVGASLALLLLSVLATVGLSFVGIGLLILLMLLPLVLGTLLTLRGGVRLLGGGTLDLNLWGERWLRGRAALIVPAALAVLFLWLRETDGPISLNANVFRSSHSTTHRWRDAWVVGDEATKLLDGVPIDDPTWSGATSVYAVAGDAPPAFLDAVADSIGRAPIPEGAVHAAVTIAPKGITNATPLFKEIDATWEGTIVLHVDAGEAGRLRWSCAFSGEMDASYHGLVAAREVPAMIGQSIGDSLRSKIADEYQEAIEKLAG